MPARSELNAGQMLGTAYPGHREVEGPRLGLGQGDQLLDAVDREAPDAPRGRAESSLIMTTGAKSLAGSNGNPGSTLGLMHKAPMSPSSSV